MYIDNNWLTKYALIVMATSFVETTFDCLKAKVYYIQYASFNVISSSSLFPLTSVLSKHS